MTNKALISELSWRTLEMQRRAFPDMPHFVAPQDITSLLRPTRRVSNLTIHVLSFAVIADDEKSFMNFLSATPRGTHIISAEEGEIITKNTSAKIAVSLWRSARAKGAAKIGGQISADRKKAKAAEGIAKIKDKWPLPSSEHSTAELLAEAGVSLNTAKAHLGKRPIAQYNYQAAQKRKERRAAK